MAVALESVPAIFNDGYFEDRNDLMVINGSGTISSEAAEPPEWDEHVLESGVEIAEDEPLSEAKFLSASPAALQFGLLSVPSEEARYSTIPLSITNHAAESLRIMRLTIGIDADSSEDFDMANSTSTGIDMEIFINGIPSGINIGDEGKGSNIGAATPNGLSDVVIPPGATLDDVIVIMCRPTSKSGSNSERGAHDFPRRFSGSLVIRAALASVESYADWRRIVARSPAVENESLNRVLLEVPFKVDVFHGSLNYDASQTYFPVGMAATNTGSMASFDQTLGRDSQVIVVGNGFPFPLMLLTADIVDDADALDYLGVGASSKGCQAQFEILVSVDSTSKGNSHDNDFFFSIRHNELEGTDRSTRVSSNQEQCGLAFQVLFGSYPPVQFVIPLRTYGGRLVARLDHSYAGLTDVSFLSCQGSLLSATGRDGNDCFANWYQNTPLGQVLKSHVGDVEGAVRQQKRRRGKEGRELQGLFEYLSQKQGDNGQTSVPSVVDPFVLDLGTLPLSSRRSYSLLLTNPNPVPMEVSPDYSGAIEGMSIGLGKMRMDSMTLLKNGAASYLDDDSRSLLSDGTGRFLSSSEPSRAFFGRLVDSDVVVPATREDCALITPQLSELFYKHATVTVRASPSSSPSAQPGGDSPSSSPPRRDGPPLLSCFSGGIIPGVDNNDECQSSSWFSRRKECGDETAAGVLLGQNGIKCLVKPAATNTTVAPGKKDAWYLPPASTARLDLTIITPPWSVLRRLSKSEGGTTNVLPFLSTGLVLRSSLGQTMPIIVTYQALLAELNAGAEGSFLAMGPYRGEEEKEIINDDRGPTGRLYHSRVDPTIVPPRGGTFPMRAVELNGDGAAKQTPLQIRSTLDDAFEIVNLTSCNPWFDFHLGSIHKKRSRNVDPPARGEFKIYDAFARSTMRCEQSSFHSCALLFLESRISVQPAGCGFSEADAAAEYAYSPELTWDNYRYEYILESVAESTMAGGAFNLESRKWNGRTMLDLAHARSHDIKIKDTTAANLNGHVHGDELQYAWQWLGVPFDYDTDSDEKLSKEGVKSAAISALRDASKHLDAMYQTSVAKLRLSRAEHPDAAFLGPLDVKPFLDARKAWEKVKEQKLHLMTGDIRATIEHRPTHDDEKALAQVTTDIPLSVLWTYLDPPSVFDSRPQGAPNATYRMDWDGTGIIDFSLTPLSGVKVVYVPVHNPSGVPIRARLTTIRPIGPNETAAEYSARWSGVDHRSGWTEDDLYLFEKDITPLHVHSCTSDGCSTEEDRWWNGGAYHQITDDGTTLKSRQNVTIRSNSGSNYVLVHPSLHVTTALVAGCGRRRCGLRDDQKQQAQSGQNEATANFLKAPERLYSAIGASAAKRIHLRGHTYDPVSGEETTESKSHKAGKCLDAFSPSCPSVHDVVPPFAIPIRSLQEEVVLAPNEKAWLGPIYFRPPAESRFGSTVLIENSLTGIEPIKLIGVGATRQIAFEEAGSEVSIDAAEIAPLEIRYGMPALMFPGSIDLTTPGRGVVKHVVVRNTGSLPVEFRSTSLSPFSLSQTTQRPVSISAKNGMRGCSVGSFSLIGCDDVEFKLEPGAVGTISIFHSPQCSSRRSFVVVNLEYSTEVAGSFALPDGEGPQLLVGFDMSDEEMAACVPAPASFADKVRRVEKLYHRELSSLNPFNWTKETPLKNGDTNIWRQLLVLVWPILLLFVCETCCVKVHRSVRRRFFSSSQIGIDEIVPGTGNGQSSMFHLLGMSQGAGDPNQHKALYQLAQSDPNAADLVQTGRDQTRRLLLGRYRRIQAAMPRCLRPSGAFVSRGGAPGAAAAAAAVPASEKDGSKPAGAAKKGTIASQGLRPTRAQGSLAEEIFGHSASSLHGGDDGAALPMALSWRGAATRGILPHPSRISLDVGNRVGDLLKKRTELRRESSFADVAVAEAVAIVDDESDDADSVPTTIMTPAKGTANGNQVTKSAKSVARKREDEEKEDDIASLLPSIQQPTPVQKLAQHYIVPGTAKKTSVSDAKVPEGDWQVQSSSNKKTVRDAAPQKQVASTSAKSGAKKPRKEDGDQVQVKAISSKAAVVPSAASTDVSSATIEPKRPQVTKKVSRRNVKSDAGDDSKSAKKNLNNNTNASEGARKSSKIPVAKQDTATESTETKTKQKIEKEKPAAKASKAVEKAKKGRKTEKADEAEKNGDGGDASAGRGNTQTKKKQKQKQKQQTDSAAASGPTDAAGSSKKKKKKAERRKSLGASPRSKPASPPAVPSKKSKKKSSIEREDSIKDMPLTPSAESELAKLVPSIRSFDGSNPSSPEAIPIAPPPGLAPPPGFLSVKGKDPGLTGLPDDASLSNLSNIPLDGGAGAPSGLGGLGTTELWLGNTSPPLGRDNQESLSGLRNDQPLATAGGSDVLPLGETLPFLDPSSPGILRGKSLLGGSGGFNVQSFLDTILDESAMVEDDYDEDGDREGGVGGAPLVLGSGPGTNDGLADAIATATAIGGHTSDLLVPQRFPGMGVSSDPWAAPSMSSGLPTAPLLTPEQILRDNATADAEEENKKEEDGSHLMALFGAGDGAEK